jgi:hypothetical protein
VMRSKTLQSEAARRPWPSPTVCSRTTRHRRRRQRRIPVRQRRDRRRPR